MKLLSLLKVSILTIVLTGTALISGCGQDDKATSTEPKGTIHIAYQYGIGYAPAMIAKEKGYLEQLLPDVAITWQLMNSGSTINAATIAGDIDFA
ncbi:MAG: hypothetical protein ROM54_11930, partial [Anaerobiospirillum sp.]|nr:hypothetical protein [Anaerobiospirillum sp.]